MDSKVPIMLLFLATLVAAASASPTTARVGYNQQKEKRVTLLGTEGRKLMGTAGAAPATTSVVIPATTALVGANYPNSYKIHPDVKEVSSGTRKLASIPSKLDESASKFAIVGKKNDRKLMTEKLAGKLTDLDVARTNNRKLMAGTAHVAYKTTTPEVAGVPDDTSAVGYILRLKP